MKISIAVFIGTISEYDVICKYGYRLMNTLIHQPPERPDLKNVAHPKFPGLQKPETT